MVFTPATEALRKEAREKRVRGVAFVGAWVASLLWWMFAGHRWDSDLACLAELGMSVLIFGLSLRAGAGRALLLLLIQPIAWVGAVGLLYATYDRAQEPSVFRIGEAAECFLEPDTRLYSCGWMDSSTCGWGRFPGVPHRYGQRRAWSLAARALVVAFGPGPGAYAGPIPTEDEAFALAAGARPVAMDQRSVQSLFSGPESHPIGFGGTHSLGVVDLGQGGLLLVWDGGMVVDLLAQASAEWSTLDLRWGHAAPLDVSVIDPP